MPRVFLSHSSRDKAIVTRLAQDLRAKGIEVWLDAWEILAGDSFIQRIQDGLQGADFVVLALSPRAVSSGWTEKEWQSRLDQEIRTRKVRIIPILLADCEIPLLLGDKHYADFRDDYEVGLATLVTAIEVHSERDSGAPLARISQCAQTARITSGGRFHPDSCRFDLVAGKQLGWVTGRAEALRRRPPWAVERSSGP